MAGIIRRMLRRIFLIMARKSSHGRWDIYGPTKFFLGNFFGAGGKSHHRPSRHTAAAREFPLHDRRVFG
jgi:hypothetical protein